VDMIGEATGLYSHKPILSLLISEIFNNALDHGVLELESILKEGADGLMTYYNEREKRLASYTKGLVKIDISHKLRSRGGQLILTVEDSGAGFDVDKVVSSTGEEAHGRGLTLVKQLSESMTFTQNGRCIEVIYPYQQD